MSEIRIREAMIGNLPWFLVEETFEENRQSIGREICRCGSREQAERVFRAVGAADQACRWLLDIVDNVKPPFRDRQLKGPVMKARQAVTV